MLANSSYVYWCYICYQLRQCNEAQLPLWTSLKRQRERTGYWQRNLKSEKERVKWLKLSERHLPLTFFVFFWCPTWVWSFISLHARRDMIHKKIITSTCTLYLVLLVWCYFHMLIFYLFRSTSPLGNNVCAALVPMVKKINACVFQQKYMTFHSILGYRKTFYWAKSKGYHLLAVSSHSATGQCAFSWWKSI